MAKAVCNSRQLMGNKLSVSTFLSTQKTALEELVKSGHLYTLYPEYHYETPPDEIPIEIRRYYNRCWHYIYAYNDMKDGNEAFKIVEKFTSKRFLSHCKPGVHD